jgi:phosphohistidine phosphatase
MPKYLFICRHAETSPAAAGQSDFDRPLTANGLLEAQRSARWIKNTGLSVPAILCSAAVRTQATARIFAQVLQLPAAAIIPDKSLYHASAADLEDRIGLLPAAQQVALLVGHNPAVSRLVGKLNSRPDQYVPPAGVNLFTFSTDDWLETDWSEVTWQANY